MSTTTDISKFGLIEITELARILNSWVENGLPSDFCADEVHPMMNFDSGYVFLTNSGFQVAMMEDNELQSFYSCPECGFEGFFHEMDNDGEKCCSDYVRECRGV